MDAAPAEVLLAKAVLVEGGATTVAVTTVAYQRLKKEMDTCDDCLPLAVIVRELLLVFLGHCLNGVRQELCVLAATGTGRTARASDDGRRKLRLVAMWSCHAIATLRRRKRSGAVTRI